MMKNIKFIFAISILISLLISCSLFTKKIEDIKESTKKEILKEFGYDQAKRDSLIKNGTKAEAVIKRVEDTNETLNNNPKVRLYLRVKPDKGEEFDAVVSTFVSRVRIPREDDIVTVYYDPNNRNDMIVK